MVIKYLEFFIFFEVMCIYTNAIVINSIDKKVITDDSTPRLFYIKENSGLVHVSSFESGIVSRLQHGEHAVAVDYHYPMNLLFWTTSTGIVYSCSLYQLKNVTRVYSDDNWQPVSFAVDYLSDRLYILDATTNTLRLLGLDGQHPIILAVGARYFQPTHIELDSNQGYVFLFDDRYGHILRMNIDGSKSILLNPYSCKIKNHGVKITLDRINKRIIVASRIHKKIFTIDYNGNILNTVLEPQNGVLSMSITRNHLFWVNAAYYSFGTSFVDGSVYKCDYKEARGCRNGSISILHESLPGIRVLVLKAVEPDNQKRTAWYNLESEVRVCQQLRLGDGCACEIGWSLANDSKRCRRIDEFFIYEDNQIVHSMCFKNEQLSRCQAIAPFKANLQFKINQRTGFTYDATTRLLYYGGKESIYRVNVDTAESKRLLYQKEIEWRGNVTYYILKVMLARTDDPKRIEESTSLLWEFGKIDSLMIHPNQGYLFVSTFDNKIQKYRLIRFNADARNLTVLTALSDFKFISLDYSEDRIYALNVNDSSILSTDLKGQELIQIANASSIIHNVTGFLVHNDVIYVKNHTNIYQFNKTNNKYLGEVDIFPYDRNMSMNFAVHSPNIFKTNNSRNPCVENNGNCENFCFALPQSEKEYTSLRKLCKCFDGIKCNAKQINK
ncbi:PREDICTED: low-density lipoprotein receptor-related protein 2-like isoform X2 [Ceratosolen solmsi marchali]|uniref:Low-density lipoprotein receptor-related protein 2-like isoform X2 n=1 Tax=Ceratosolen solmsi marchali TaxID=326594 RepID=A0AAJ6YI87_9HYME|nr:PREDICTED: low-density lipoprotein receptor-related protein 2-like isoform X2 [Ceratosolen solmsi marchali]